MAVLKSACATSSYNPAQSDKQLTVAVQKLLGSVLPLPLPPLSCFFSDTFQMCLNLGGMGGRRKKNVIPRPAASSGVRRPLWEEGREEESRF